MSIFSTRTEKKKNTNRNELMIDVFSQESTNEPGSENLRLYLEYAMPTMFLCHYTGSV